VKLASPKKNANKNDPNQKNQVKQNKLISSEHCEKNCKNVSECQKYKDYLVRMVGRACYGIRCDK